MAENHSASESLSAFMDNEADELATRRFLKGASEDDSLRQQWHRYQLAAAAMRRELPARGVDLSDRIRAAVAQEPAAKPSLARVLHPLGKVAVAASVAVVAVLGAQQLLPVQPTLNNEPAMAASSGDSSPQFQLPAGFDYPPVSGRTVSAGAEPHVSAPPVLMVKPVGRELPNEAAVETYLNRMMQRHTENAATAGPQGLLPFGRLPQNASDSR